MARPKTYIIKFTDDEKAEFQRTIHNKKNNKNRHHQEFLTLIVSFIMKNLQIEYVY